MNIVFNISKKFSYEKEKSLYFGLDLRLSVFKIFKN
jgi:hypothetical protein